MARRCVQAKDARHICRWGCGVHALAIYDSGGQFPRLGDGVSFPLPYASITGGRIVPEDPFTGIRLEAFRIGYDRDGAAVTARRDASSRQMPSRRTSSGR